MNKTKQYNYTNDEIPLSTKISQEEEEYKHYSQQGYEQNENNVVNSHHQTKRSRLSLFVKPIFLTLISIFLSIALLLLFLHADGKLLDYTIIGMKIPSLVSFLLSVNLIFIVSGLSTAISEYKWVRLQNGAPLTLIDIYDGCTRGISGFFSTFTSLQFDAVLVVGLVIHIGLIAVSPASQAVLVAVNDSYTTKDVNTRIYYYRSDTGLITRSGLESSRQPPLMNGLAHNSYITASSFAQAAIRGSSIPQFICPEDATYCMFDNITYVSTSMQCTNITGRDTAIVNHNGGTQRSVVVLDEYFTNTNISTAKVQFPKFLYSSEMLGRTYYDLANYTQPLMPGLNIPLTQAPLNEYDPQYRPYVGDQIFVMAYNMSDNSATSSINFTELSYKKCSFTSSLNTSTWKTANGTLIQYSVESSVPIVFDYDNVLGNNTALDPENITTNKVGPMINAYIMQQALLYELTTPRYYTMSDYMRTYAFTTTNNNRNNFEEFMKAAITIFDYAFFQSPAVSGRFQDIVTLPKEGVAYFTTQTRYKVNKVDCVVLCLCLVLPVVWWLIVWIISIKKNNGISRGSSQIVLLSAGMTPLANQHLQGLSNLDSSSAFKQAKNIRVRLNVSKERMAFGIENEHDSRRL